MLQNCVGRHVCIPIKELASFAMLNVEDFYITTIFYKKAWEEIPINELARNSLLVKWLAYFNNL